MIKWFSVLIPVLTIILAENLSAQIQFKPYQTYINGSNAVSLKVKDINLDGRADIALTTGWVSGSAYNYKLFIYYQKPDGTLDNPIVLDVPQGGSGSVDVGDLNNDSKQDIVVAQKDSISVFYQTTQTKYVRKSFYSGPDVDAIAIGDLNNDKLDDIAVSHFNGLFVKVFYQSNLGNLDALTYPSPKGGLVRLEILDLNNDSLNDLLFFSTAGYDYGLYFYIQNSTGSLNFAVSYNTGLEFLNGIATGNLNNDLKKDIVITAGGNYPAKLGIFIKNNNIYQFETPISLKAYDIPKPVIIHDLNCDGTNEIIIAHAGWNALSIYEQNQNNQYDTYKRVNNTYGIYGQRSMDIGDLNGDGRPDIALASGNLIIHYNDTKPPISRTIIHSKILDSYIANNYTVKINKQSDTLSSYILIRTDSLRINNPINNLYSLQYHYGIQEGIMCGKYLKDSLLIDSSYVFSNISLPADTVILSQTIDSIILGLEEYQFDKRIRLFPNPSDGKFTMEINELSGNTDIFIYTMKGIQVYSMKKCSNGIYTIDLNGNPKGIYLIVCKINNSLYYKRKLIIQ
jgi:hypothetical protein